MSDYLWDRSGPPDPEVERLEELLRPLGDPGTPRRRPAPSRWPWYLAAAAAVVVIGGAGWLYQRAQRPAWALETAHTRARLHVGDWFTARESTRLQVADIGRVDLDPGSRVRLESTAKGAYRLRLETGRLQALIVAPPRTFSVDTPAATAVDLGCAYTLEVQPGGDSDVQVQTGWVAFRRGEREVFIPAGARCRTSAQRGLGVPYYLDAPPRLKDAVAQFESSGSWTPGAALRAKDALTLWHLLPRASREQREFIHSQLGQIMMIPKSIAKERVLAADPGALDELWRALELGDADFWRRWQQPI